MSLLSPSNIWQQGWISSYFCLNAVISKQLDGPNNSRPQALHFPDCISKTWFVFCVILIICFDDVEAKIQGSLSRLVRPRSKTILKRLLSVLWQLIIITVPMGKQQRIGGRRKCCAYCRWREEEKEGYYSSYIYNGKFFGMRSWLMSHCSEYCALSP